MTDAEIVRMSPAERIGEGIRRGVARLAPAVQQQLQALVTPEALGTAAAFFVAWIVSHAMGVGFVIDALFLGAGVVAIGFAVFSGVDELMQFGRGAVAASTGRQMDAAAGHFAAGVGILGVQAVMALLLKRAPQSFRGGRVPVGAPPAAGFVIKPGLRATRSLPAGGGVTSWWGEITISRLGSATDRRLVALHEAVHRALTPKLGLLRGVRVEGRAASYTRSSFAMYLEEALAESFAQVSVQGIRHLFTGIVFPVRNGYVSLFVRRVANGMPIEPVMPEVAALYLGIVNVQGWILDAYLSDRPPEGR